MDAHPWTSNRIQERLHERLDLLASQLGIERGIRFTCGVAIVEAPPEDIDELVRLADEDLQVRRKKASEPIRP
jgi:hypothetical protein